MSSDIVNPILPEFLERLDPELVSLYDKYQSHKLRADQVTIEEYRANPAKYTADIPPGPKPEVASSAVHKVKVTEPEGEIDVKVYVPTQEAVDAGRLDTASGLPAHVNFHGGGWVIGSLLSDESWCRQASQSVGMIIVDVDYRLAPEYPFPTQIWDAWQALKWVFGKATELGIDKSRVSIGGLSAGGHLAAVLAHLARDEKDMPPLKLQLLVVPSVDGRFIPLEGSPDPAVPYKTYISCEYAPCLPMNRMRWFSRHWLGSDVDERKKKAESWLCSPILAPSHKDLAPCSIRSAEFDVLVDEGLAYNELLNKSGTSSKIKIYKGVCHPFGHYHELGKCQEYFQDTFEDLRRAHAM